MSTTIVAGGDFGTSDSTLAWRTRRGFQHRTIPSYVGLGDDSDLLRIRSCVSKDKTRRDDDLQITYRGTSYFVGQLALDQQLADPAPARNNANHYNGGNTLKLLLALAAQHLPNHTTLRLITGTSVTSWTPQKKQEIQRCLIGTHEYTFRGQPRTLTVEAVGVMMVGAAVLHDVATQEIPQAVIDVGSTITDLFWAVGRAPILERCASYRVGVEKVGDLISRAMANEVGGRQLEPYEIGSILRAVVDKQLPQPHRYNAGKELVLDGSVTAAIDTVANELTQFVAQTWGSDRGIVAGEAPHVRLIGGGAYYFKSAFKALIPHIVVPKQPELQNALSYLAVGEVVSEDAWVRNRG